ncbi:hypothetical protein KGM_211200 [Danaus plexippus plexippus]|uniref:Uncharacterized protein n=1 Tax=Danaus plexippus plexippus TaxID=278856 RepID=A0A212FD40_DANPL|nr:hypothetical protein KGM_211200 [Danaus plexippus plexippus]
MSMQQHEVYFRLHARHLGRAGKYPLTGEEHPGQKQRKGFFRNLWKKSRHYSLEHP